MTIVKPDTGGRFQSLLVINEDHYVQQAIYDPGTYTFTQDEVGTRYIQMNARTLVDPNDPHDVDAAHQGAGRLAGDPGRSRRVRRAQLGSHATGRPAQGHPHHDAMGAGQQAHVRNQDEVDQVRHFIGTAAGFGGNPEQDAIYLSVVPEANDGQTAHVLRVKDVPVEGFWSVIVYNADGFFEAPEATVSVNNVTATPDADGTTTIHFGGDPTASNYLRIMPGWNYTVRLYRPRQEILDGTWTFPMATPR